MNEEAVRTKEKNNERKEERKEQWERKEEIPILKKERRKEASSRWRKEVFIINVINSNKKIINNI